MTREIIRSALYAWGVGIVFAGLVVLPVMFALQSADPMPLDKELALRAWTYLGNIPEVLILATLVCITLGLPLFLIALTVALIFGARAGRYPILWSLTATAVTVALVAGQFAATRDNQWAQSHGFWEKVLHIAQTWDTWVFALPVAAASYFYCRRISRFTTIRKDTP